VSEPHEPYRISEIGAWPIDIPLTDAFVISKGSVTTAENVFVSVTLAGGAVGFGEAAPFAPLTGETRAGTLDAVETLRPLLEGQTALNSARLSAVISEALPGAPAARAAVECAVVDALCRAAKLPLWAYWGGAGEREYTTDVTLPILAEDRTVELAAQWYQRGFRTFKLKVGAGLDRDVELIEKLAAINADTSFILDANQGFSLDDARAFLRALVPYSERVILFEQPVARDDIDGMASLRRQGDVAIAADESVFTAADARRVVEAGAAHCINLKITKSGLFETIRIAAIAREAGLQLMIGGMVESRLAMGFSLCLASGLGIVRHFDLDTPLLMSQDPVVDGYTYDGPVMRVTSESGVGCRPAT